MYRQFETPSFISGHKNNLILIFFNLKIRIKILIINIKYLTVGFYNDGNVDMYVVTKFTKSPK